LALASVLIHATVDFPMQIASLQLYTTVVLGMLAALQYAESSHRRRFKATPGTGPLEEPGVVEWEELVFQGRKA
jgi:hypothetical protein